MSTQPSKLVPERITIYFNFLDVLEWGDSIIRFNANVEVSSGVDPTPDSILFGRPDLAGSVVSQQIHRGVPGVIYKVITTVETLAGDIWIKEVLVAILVDATPIPPPFGIFITSTPYPYYFMDEFAVSSDVISGYELGVILDEYGVSSDLISGTLRDLFQMYTWPAEDYTVSSNIISGSLVMPRVTYTNPPESYAVSSLIISGSIVTILIVYNNWPPESINTSSDIISGSLV